MREKQEYFGRILLEKLKVTDNALSFIINMNNASILSRRISIAKEANKKEIHLRVNTGSLYLKNPKKRSFGIFVK